MRSFRHVRGVTTARSGAASTPCGAGRGGEGRRRGGARAPRAPVASSRRACGRARARHLRGRDDDVRTCRARCSSKIMRGRIEELAGWALISRADRRGRRPSAPRGQRAPGKNHLVAHRRVASRRGARSQRNSRDALSAYVKSYLSARPTRRSVSKRSTRTQQGSLKVSTNSSARPPTRQPRATRRDAEAAPSPEPTASRLPNQRRRLSLQRHRREAATPKPEATPSSTPRTPLTEERAEPTPTPSTPTPEATPTPRATPPRLLSDINADA